MISMKMWSHFDKKYTKVKKGKSFKKLISGWKNNEQKSWRYSSNFLSNTWPRISAIGRTHRVTQRKLMMRFTFNSSYLCSSIHNDGGQTRTANQINNIDEWMKTKHEKKKREELMLEEEVVVVLMHTAWRRWREFFFSLSLSLYEIFLTKRKERIPNSITTSILFHFLNTSFSLRYLVKFHRN